MPLTISHYKSDTIADFTGTVTVNNSSGGTNTMMATDLVRPSDWNSVHSTSMQLSGSELYSIGLYEPFPMHATNSTLSTPAVGTWQLDPFVTPAVLGSGQLNFLIADAAGFLNGSTFSAASTGSVTRSETRNTQICIYKLGAGAQSSRLESIWSTEVSQKATWERRVSNPNTSNVTISNYLTVSIPSQVDGSGGFTYGTTSTSGTTSVGASTAASTVANNLITAIVAFVSGSRLVPVPFATTLAAGAYYIGWMNSSSTSSSGTNYSTGTLFSAQSMVGLMEFVDQAYKRIGKSASDSSTAHPAFHGFLQTTSATPYSTVATSDVRNLATKHRRYWNYQQSSY